MAFVAILQQVHKHLDSVDVYIRFEDTSINERLVKTYSWNIQSIPVSITDFRAAIKPDLDALNAFAAKVNFLNNAVGKNVMTGV
jgi:hypothetical protein